MARLSSRLIQSAWRHLLAGRKGYETLLDAIGPRAAERLPYALDVPAVDVYQELPKRPEPGDEGSSDRPVFVTARFRSGSTLLWNLFRSRPDFCAYYEPLNERRWFDASSRGNKVDPTHVGANDYWREYEGLQHLSGLFEDRWRSRNLWLGADSVAPGLGAYLQALIDAAPRRPLLQFNRVDFRLGWLRAQFPQAQIVHLYRHPREQWCSTLRRLDGYRADMGWDEFRAYDRFYLQVWARDLRREFPVIDRARTLNAYATFYILWRLSHAFGRKAADHSLAYEALVSDPSDAFEGLLRGLGATTTDIGSSLAPVIEASEPRWPQWASDGWFSQIESLCETWLYEDQRSFASPDSAVGEPRVRPQQ